MASPPSQQAICALTGFVSLLEMARAKARAPPDFSTNATKPPPDLRAYAEPLRQVLEDLRTRCPRLRVTYC